MIIMRMRLTAAMFFFSVIFAKSEKKSTCRDRFLEPFSNTSIWNTAIGSDATFSPANLFETEDLFPTQFHNDQEFFVRVNDLDPEFDWIDQGDWGPDKKCVVTGEKVRSLRLPVNFTTASDCDENNEHCRSAADQMNNNPMGILLEDQETIVQMQPAYRCDLNGPFLARFGNNTDGCPQNFPNITSIFSEGIYGAHGGSGLSGVGGMIRLGELLPDSPPISHALKIEFQHIWYFGLYKLANDSTYNGGRSQYVWPATGSDSGSSKVPGGLYSGTDPNMVPGALLSFPSSISTLSLKTTVGKKIFDALYNYGAYIVDDTGGENSVAICMDALVNAEMRRTYGYNMAYPGGMKKGFPLYQDLLTIFQNLHAVTNNGPGHIGGGGIPRKPTKGPICLL